MLPNSKQNIGLVGAGYWGKNLVRVFNKLNVLSVVCDTDEEILEKTKVNYPNIETTQDFNNLLKDDSLTGLVIATPAATHYQLTKQALSANKNVFVEKPLALNIKQGKELVDLAKSRGLILMVGHLMLYHPAIVKLKELVEQGELGKIQYICSNRLNFGKIRTEENVLWSFAPHDISMLMYLIGMPKKVICQGKAYLQKGIQDIALVSLEFDNNKAGHIFVSWLNPFKEQKLSVIGKEKMAVYDGVTNELTVFEHKIEQSTNGEPKTIKADGQIIDFPDQEPLMQEAKHFLDCLQTKQTPKTSGAEALNVLKVLSLAQDSLE